MVACDPRGLGDLLEVEHSEDRVRGNPCNRKLVCHGHLQQSWDAGSEIAHDSD